MKIEFKPLSETHFILLLKWLEAPHVKQWWDQNINYNEKSIEEKYSSYVNGYKLKNGEKKAISAFIIYLDDKPIGYIQLYNTYDFLRNKPLANLSKSLGAIDFYIGEEEYLGKGIGSAILREFNYQNYDYILVDPDKDNYAAIKTYEKAGFKKIEEQFDTNEVWMIKENLKVVSTKNTQSYKWQEHCDGWWIKRIGKFTIIEEMMPPGTHEIKHFHSQVEQFFYCLEGEIHIEIDSKEYVLSKNEGISIKATIAHQVFNRSSQNVRFLVVSYPNAYEDRVNFLCSQRFRNEDSTKAKNLFLTLRQFSNQELFSKSLAF